jgi:hypothetical protein
MIVPEGFPGYNNSTPILVLTDLGKTIAAKCPIAVMAALEVTCPNNGISGNTSEVRTIKEGNVTACTAAQDVTAIYRIIHLGGRSNLQGSKMITFKNRMTGDGNSIAKPIDIANIVKFKQQGCQNEGEVMVAGRCEPISCSGNSIRVRATCVPCPSGKTANPTTNACE